MQSSYRRPEFVIAGATRSGTSTLHHALMKSPYVFMPQQKEIHFFARDSLYAQGEAMYASFFDDAEEGQICGEATPTYFTHGHMFDDSMNHYWSPDDDSVVRMAKMYPDMKVILSIRHPAVRAHSFFWRMVWQGQEKAKSLEVAIEEELKGGRYYMDTVYCPLYLSRYSIHLRHWLKHFKRENIKILIMEEWTKEPAKTLAEIEAFIGVQHSGLLDEDIQKTNVGRRALHPALRFLSAIKPTSRISRALTRRFLSKKGYPDLNAKTFQRLSEIFEEDIHYVEDILGREIKAWRGMSV